MRILCLEAPVEKEVYLKIIKEILTLYHIEIDSSFEQYDYESITFQNEIKSDAELHIASKIILKNGDKTDAVQRTLAHSLPQKPSEIHRLFKLNLFYLFEEKFGKVIAPWGILHGVRPTKIVQRYLEEGLAPSKIEEKLERDYAVSASKAALLTRIAARQMPIIKSSGHDMVSIYIGIPFCVSRCLYCSFPSNLLPQDHGIITAYLDALQQEMMAVCEMLKQYHLKVQSIYIGGGTPTSLPAADFAALLALTRKYFGSDLAEFTVEAGRPDTIDLEKIKSMQSYQVTRISVNPQTMQERTLRLIGRSHSPSDIIRVYEQIREHTTAKINMDTILGLPSETIADVRATFEQIIELSPDDITVHALAIKKGSRLKLCKKAISLPSDAEASKMGQLVETLLSRAGYQPYYLYRQGYMSGQLENIGYCREGAYSIYNIEIMSEQQTILGIGCNASTKVIFEGENGKYLQTVFNPKDLDTYFSSLPSYIEKRRALVKAAYGNK